MKRLWLLAILLGGWPGPGMAQTTDELVNDGKNTDNVTTQSMGYDRKSYSPLRQINTSNIKRLVPIWTRISDFAVVPYGQDQSPRLDFWGSDARNRTTEGDTRWVNDNMSHFSSRSTAS